MRQNATQLLFSLLAGSEEHRFRGLSEDAWRALATSAAAHRVAPLVWHNLTSAGRANTVPAAVRQTLEAEYTLASFRARAWREQLILIMAALRVHEIPVAHLKGAHLAIHLYDSAAVRPMADIDLLVRPEHAAAALEVIVQLGYARPADPVLAAYQSHRHLPPLTRPGRLPVELHTTVDPCEPPFRLSLEDVWERTQPDEAFGSATRTMGAEDLLLHLATHMGYSHLLGSSLVRVCDTAVWLERYGARADWDAIISRSEAAGISRFVYTALELSRRQLGSSSPKSVRDALRGEADDAAVEYAIALLGHPWDVLPDMLLLTRSGTPVWGGVRRVAAALLIPPTGGRSEAGNAPGDIDVMARRSRYRERWQTVRDVVRNPAAARDVARGLKQVRQLWKWAQDFPGSP